MSSQLLNTQASTDEHKKHAIMVTNAQNGYGAAICHELLNGHHRKHFPVIKAAVKDVVSSGDLLLLGAHVVQMDMLRNHLDDVRTMVIVPAFAKDDMVEMARITLKAAKAAKVKNIVVMSKMGIDGVESKTAAELRQIEEICRKTCEESHIHYCIIRMGVLMNCLLTFSPMILEGKLEWPVDKSAKFAPLHTNDIARFVAHILKHTLGEETSRGRTFNLTGRKMYTPETMVEFIHRVLGGQAIEYQKVDPKQTERYFREQLGQNNQLVRVTLDEFVSMNLGKLDQITDDLEKAVQEPMSVEQFLKTDYMRFRKEE